MASLLGCCHLLARGTTRLPGWPPPGDDDDDDDGVRDDALRARKTLIYLTDSGDKMLPLLTVGRICANAMDAGGMVVVRCDGGVGDDGDNL